MKNIKIPFRSMGTTHCEKEPQKTTIPGTDMENIRVTDTVKFGFVCTEWLVEQNTLGMRLQERSSFVDKHVTRNLKRSRFHRSVLSMSVPTPRPYRDAIFDTYLTVNIKRKMFPQKWMLLLLLSLMITTIITFISSKLLFINTLVNRLKPSKNQQKYTYCKNNRIHNTIL
jgi:hypothetical protein